MQTLSHETARVLDEFADATRNMSMQIVEDIKSCPLEKAHEGVVVAHAKAIWRQWLALNDSE